MVPIVEVSTHTRNTIQNRRARAAFSLIDLLVAIAVIAVLISLMIPSLAAVRETTRRVVCSSNQRQLGIATAMYADDARGNLPFSRNYTKSLSDNTFSPRYMMYARLGFPTNRWDGLGLLFDRQYCAAPEVFYCPSHAGEARYDAFARNWATASGDIVTNFQYRGGTSRGETNFNRFSGQIAIITDGLSSGADFSHRVGSNVVASDLSVAWFDDRSGALTRRLPGSPNESGAKDKVLDAWLKIDGDLGFPIDAPFTGGNGGTTTLNAFTAH